MKIWHGLFLFLIFGISWWLGHHFRGDRPSLRDKEEIGKAKTVTYLGEGTESLVKMGPKLDGVTVEFPKALQNHRDLISWISRIPPDSLANTFESYEDDSVARQMIAVRWAEVDPTDFLEYLLEKRGIGSDWETLYSAWVRQDSNRAIASLEAVAPKDHSMVRKFLFGELFRHDVDLAIQSYRSVYGDGFPDIPKEVVSANPEKIARLILESKVVDYSSGRDLADAVSFWYERDSKSALEFVSRLRGAAASAAIPLIRKWTKEDPAAAADFINNHLAIEVRREASRELARSWARRDPHAAWDWVEENLMGQQKLDSLQNVILSAANVDPAISVKMIHDLPEDRQIPTLYNFAANFFHSDRESALDWALAQTYPEYRTAALRAISQNWAGKDFRSMGKFSRENIESLPVEFIKPLASRWGGIYPREAMGWQTKLPDPHGVPAASLIMQSWARKTPDAAAKFLLSMGHPDKRNGAFPLVAEQFLKQDQAGAIAWLKSLSDDKRFSIEAVRNAVTGSQSLSQGNREIILRELELKQ